MAKKPKKPVGPPMTIVAIEALEQGQSMTYYRGNITSDLARCNPRGGNDHGAPNYRRLLCEIFDFVEDQVKAGKLALSQYNIPRASSRRGQKGTAEPIIGYMAHAL